MTGIIIVNYKTVDLTVKYIKEEISKIKHPVVTVVVNVASDEESDRKLAEELAIPVISDITSPVNLNQQVFLVSSKENLGYAKGNNLGVDFLLNHFSEIDSYLFSNNDIVLEDSDVVEALYEQLFKSKDIGAIGPEVIGPMGLQGPYRRLNFWQYILRFILPQKIYRKFWSKLVSNPKSGYHYWLIGCFLMVRKDAFLKAGKFDSQTFIYQEEQILAERMLRNGHHFYYYNSKRIRHENGATINKYQVIANRVKCSFESEMIYYKKYIGLNWFELFFANLSYRFFLLTLKTFRQPLGRLLSKKNNT